MADDPNPSLTLDATTRVVCEHAFECAGCPLIDEPYIAQLAFKAERVRKAFACFGTAPAIEPVAPASTLEGYRSRAKLMVSNDGKIGLFAKGGGHRVVDIPRCRVLAPALVRVRDAVHGLMANDPTAQVLRALDLREVRNPEARVLVTFVVDRQTAPEMSELQRLAELLRKQEPSVCGVAVNYRNVGSPQVLGEVTTHLTGAMQAADAHGRSTHLATFGSFVQAHREQAGIVHDAAIAAVASLRNGKTPKVLDLYGGSGAIGLALAKEGAEVELVESFPAAVDRAREAARTQKVKLRALASDAARAMRDFAAKKRRFDAVVVNPPRRGMSPEARERIADVGPAVVVYVSCDPETLARDLAHLALRGFVADKLQPVDMMPLTEEIETVATLRRHDPPAPHVLFRDEDVLVVSKEAHEPMRFLEARVRKLEGADQASPLTSLDLGVSGVVLFARSQDKVAPYRAWLQAGSTRISFVAACRGITRDKGTIARGSKHGPPATVRYRRLAVAGGHSVVRVTVDGMAEGADGLVRKRLAEVGHPVLGDERSCDPRTNKFFEERNALDRPFLHAVRIELERGEAPRLAVEGDLAGDLRITIQRLSPKEILSKLDEKNAFGGASIPPPPPAP
ncbi:MAG: RsmD family RNA methyltransferase [Polyangiaceae bacterium]